MDAREMIIQKVMQTLEGRVDARTADTVQDVLVIQLNNYEVQERCTEVATVNDSAERMLDKFIATKRVEGIAESTLQRYEDQCWKLIQFLRKPLYEVTTYDIRFYLSYRREKAETKVSNRTLDGMRRCYSSFFWLAVSGRPYWTEPMRRNQADKIPKGDQKALFRS